MTWTLYHDNKKVGEWSDDVVKSVGTKLRKSNSEKLRIIAEFLPDPIRDAFGDVN